MYGFVCQYFVIHVSFLRGSILCYNTMCSFAVMTLSFQSIFSLLVVRAVVPQLWQIAVPTARSRCILYQSLGSEELSLPSGFLSEMFHNRSRSKHVQTQAAVRVVETSWIIHSQPPRQYQQRVSVCLVAAEQHPVTLQLFFWGRLFFLVLTLTGFT